MSGARDGERSILVTGGTKGIGLAIASRLAEPGAQIFLNYRADDASANKAADALRQRGATAHLLKEDVGTVKGATAVAERIAGVTNRLDVLVHGAAIPNSGLIAEQDLDKVLEALNVSGLGLLYLVRASLGLLREGSSVLFISGNAVDVILPKHGALAIAKALGECLIRYLAIELAPRGINFNTLRAGPVDSELRRAVMTAPPPVTPNGRRLIPEDIAEVAAFLVSPAAAMLRGEVVTVDGALTTARLFGR